MMAPVKNLRITNMSYTSVNTASLNSALKAIGGCPGSEHNCRELKLLNIHDDERVYAEAFVQQVFYSAYQARLDSFYPLLLSISADTSTPAPNSADYAAVAGVRPAGGEQLFLENYLELPIEQLTGVRREQIIEIGNLAPASAGQARWLITTLNAFMLGAGFTHVVFTAVPKLKNAFSRMGLPLTQLAEADGDCLPAEEKAKWGNYYEAKPKVFVGDLRVGEGPLTAIAKTDPFLEHLCQRATVAGEEFRAILQQRH
jgi:hypothetical protein